MYYIRMYKHTCMHNLHYFSSVSKLLVLAVLSSRDDVYCRLYSMLHPDSHALPHFVLSYVCFLVVVVVVVVVVATFNT